MIKNVSRLLIVLMVFSLTFSSLPSISSASGNEGTRITKDDKFERVAETIYNGVTTIATFDKKANILTIEEEGKEIIKTNLGELSEEYLEEGLISDEPKMLSEDGVETYSNTFSEYGINRAAATTKQNTFINYEYTITHSSPEKWQLRRPQDGSLAKYYYKNVTRTTKNKSDLINFQSRVESINALEWTFIGSSLTTVGLSWLTFILSVPTAGAGSLASGLAALGAYGATNTAMIKIHGHVNKARTYYFAA